MFSAQLLASLALAVSASALSIETHQLEARAPALPSGWKLTSSCAADVTGARVFAFNSILATQRHVFTKDLTPNKCLSTCSRNGYGYAALRMGTEVRSAVIISSMPC